MSTNWFRLRLPREEGYYFLDDMKTAIRNDFIKKPLYFDSLLAHPPAHIYGVRTGQKVKRIEYPEDRLRKTLFKHKPELLEYPHRTSSEDLRWYRHPADLFVFRQLELIKQGMTESAAFKKVESEMEEEKANQAVEVEIAKQHAEKLGVPDRSKQEIHRRVLLYKQAAQRWRELEHRRRRDRIEQLVRLRRDLGEKELISPDTVADISEHEMKYYLRLYPENAKYFAEHLRNVELTEERNYLEDEQDRYSEIPPNKLITEEPQPQDFPKEMVNTPQSFVELDAFDRSENPIRHQEFRRYLRQLNLKSVSQGATSPVLNPRAPPTNPDTTLEKELEARVPLPPEDKSAAPKLPSLEDDEELVDKWVDVHNTSDLDVNMNTLVGSDYEISNDTAGASDGDDVDLDMDFTEYNEN